MTIQLNIISCNLALRVVKAHPSGMKAVYLEKKNKDKTLAMREEKKI
jgi:hypothetical protein